MHRRRFVNPGIWQTMPTIAAFTLMAATGVLAQPASPHHEFLGGPWEVLVKMGLEGAALRLPLAIANENKPQELNAIIPVAGTPLQVKLERYLPDLKRETTAVEDPNGGPAAKLSLRGENLQQDLWLCAGDREKQSISAHIGGVAIRELPSGGPILQELTEPDAVGVLLVWLSETSTPLAYTVKPGRIVALPGSPWKLSILRYVPHYSVNRETKEVTSLSDKPENPAVEVRVEGDQQEYRQWLWSQFAMSPHKMQRLPFRARFLDFQLAGAGQYILAVVPGPQSYLLSWQGGKKHVETVEPGKRYPFDDKRYSFAVEEVRGRAKIETTWKNGSEMLLHPALVATIVQGSSAQPVVLELGQPCHQKTSVGTLVVLYRHTP